MPSFEFIVPQGFLFISANLSFISFCFFISFILSKILKSAIVFFVLLIALLSMAYSDLFLKFAIKNFYELTQMDSKIYMYPTKNEAQKVDSLSIVNISFLNGFILSSIVIGFLLSKYLTISL